MREECECVPRESPSYVSDHAAADRVLARRGIAWRSISTEAILQNSSVETIRNFQNPKCLAWRMPFPGGGIAVDDPTAISIYAV